MKTKRWPDFVTWKRVLDEAFRSAFGGWSDKDWERFDEVYFQSVG